MKTIVMHLSAYDAENPAVVLAKEEADQHFQEGKLSRGFAVLDLLNQPAMLFLRDRLGSFETLAINQVFGMYGGLLEPSLQVVLQFRDNDEWALHSTAVKRVMISFGRTFRQTNVHLLELHPEVPPDQLAEIQTASPFPDVSYQREILTVLRIQSANLHPNIANLQRWGSESGIQHFTTDLIGGSFVVYSISDDIEFAVNSRTLMRTLEENNLLEDAPVACVVAWTNYGRFPMGGGGYGQTHNYDEAEQYLSSI